MYLQHAWAEIVWTPPLGTGYSNNIWAPELHYLQDKWYIYFAADNGQDVNHRMYVLESSSEDPLEGTWEMKGKVSDASDKWAIDGTILEYKDKLYFIWSGWKGDNDPGVQQLRSEEHTSDIQSLMRISYAVFCLKTYKPTQQQQHNQHITT